MLSNLANNVGYSHLSAVLMAMEHFNERNPVIVKQLENSKYRKSNCNFTFDMDTSTVIDSGGSYSHMGIRNSLKDFVNNGVPCAIAGPYSELASQDVAKLSTAADIPMVIAKSFNKRLGNEYTHPMVSQVSPGFAPVVEILYQFLIKHKRNNFYNILYQSSDIGLYMHEIITRKFREENKIYYSHDSAAWAQAIHTNHTTIKSEVTKAMESIKGNGYRTIIMVVEVLIDIFFIADAAEELEMIGNDKYLYVIIGSFELSGMEDVLRVISYVKPNIIKLLRGSAFITPVESFMLDPDNDSFLKVWKANDERFVKLVNSKYPIQDNPNEYGYYQGTDDYFQKFDPQIGSAYMYDAVMSIGLGACLGPPSLVTNLEGTTSNNYNECSSSSDNNKLCSTNDFSALHLQGIRDVGFHGATGAIMFGDEKDRNRGIRIGATSLLGVVNLLPPTLSNEDGNAEELKIYEVTDYSIGYSSKYGLTEVHDFVFNNNTTKPPADLQPDENCISPYAQIAGLVLMMIAIMFSFFCAAWTFWFRLHRIVTASQPIFLYLLCFGCCLFSLAIFFISFDESSGFTIDQLGTNCMASVWFLCLGHLLIYGALFTKLWRINKVLQFRKTKVEIRHVAWPLLALLVAAILILLLWTILSPLEWKRYPLDLMSGESVGKCSGNFAPAFPLFLICVIPCIATCFMAYKAKDIEDTYAESKWIFVLVLVQIQMVISAAPTVVLLGREDVSSSARYLGLTIFIYSYSISALMLVMVPKMVAHYNVVNGKNKISVVRGGGNNRGVVHVSGLPNYDFSNSATAANNFRNKATNVKN